MKLSSISFALVLIFSLAACNGKKESSAPTNTATGPSSKIQLKSNTAPDSGTELGIITDTTETSEEETTNETENTDHKITTETNTPTINSSDQIKILTFNVMGYSNSKNKVERFNAICEELTKAAADTSGWEVVLLQGVWKLKDRHQLKSCGYPFNDSDVDTSKNFKTSGLLTLSKYKIIKTAQLPYPTAKNLLRQWTDGENSRMAQYSQIQIKNNYYLWVVNTELSLNDHNSKNAEDDDERRIQVDSLSKWIASEIPEGRVILGGTFNLAPKGINYTSLWDDLEKYFKDFKQNVFPSKITCTLCSSELNSYGSSIDEGKTDHLFARKLNGVSSKIVLTNKISVKNKEVNLSNHFGFEETFQY